VHPQIVQHDVQGGDGRIEFLIEDLQ
jgi:hypothetical protein